MMKRVLHNTHLQRVAGAENTTLRYAGKTLRSLRKKAWGRLEPHVHHVMMQLSGSPARSIWVVTRKYAFRPIRGTKGFLFLSPRSLYIIYIGKN